ncbi:MAG TPA: energy transducer TonB [Vicinamibacteria bacterium]|nr:energy transducer TonB [Vicinamibacteria bacterium]
MSACPEIRDHLLTFGNRDAVHVFQHLASCAPCERFAARVLRLEARLRALAEVTVPDGWVERLCARPELTSPPAGAEPIEERPFGLRQDLEPRGLWSARGFSFLLHAACLLIGLALSVQNEVGSPSVPSPAITIRFYEPGASGPGGGGGGGGSAGPSPAAPSPTEQEFANAESGPLAPRAVPALELNALSTPELPEEVTSLLDTRLSPDAVRVPGLTSDVPGGPRADSPSSGTGGGIGGGEGSGLGTGEGWGVGPGKGGGFGSGDYAPGSWDIDPVLIHGLEPAYPARALERRIQGEVLLQIRVRVDGSTEVLRVLKALPYCVEAATEAAKRYRWKPALKAGKPVEAVGVLTVRFELVPQR